MKCWFVATILLALVSNAFASIEPSQGSHEEAAKQHAISLGDIHEVIQGLPESTIQAPPALYSSHQDSASYAVFSNVCYGYEAASNRMAAGLINPAPKT